MSSILRVTQALAHERADRTPLFELFQPYHPIHWPVCGRTVATDQAMAWDAMADGIAWEELLQAEIKAEYAIRSFFGVDMVRLNSVPPRDYVRPVKTGPQQWTRDGIPYVINPRTKLVEYENPGEQLAMSARQSEEVVRRAVDTWEGRTAAPVTGAVADPLLEGVRRLAEKDGHDWVFMAEIGAGTGVAFYPPFMLMWLIEEPEMLRRWLAMQAAVSFARTRQLIRAGCRVVAMGGDVSCDKGPFLSPAHYHEFILPIIQQHVELIHAEGARAVYTSDGNHWPIKDDFFFNSGIDGYKEVDQAAGMTWPRLLAEGVADRICIIGNTDARHTLCHGSLEDVRAEVVASLKYGQSACGGHILHNSHSVHEDVKSENYYMVVSTYRDYFGLPPLAMEVEAFIEQYTE